MTVPYKDHGQAFAKIVSLFGTPLAVLSLAIETGIFNGRIETPSWRWRSVESLKDLNLHLRIRGSCSSLESQTRDWKGHDHVTIFESLPKSSKER
jgi:hypothetical protein